jgi:predicted dehydrogenase
VGQLKAAVVGVGWMGSVYARIVAQAHNAELVAVCSRSRETVDPIARELGTTAYTDARVMFKEQKGIQATIIATPESAHLDPVRAAVEAGSNILLEKPVATVMSEAREIIQLACEAGVTLGVCHHLRFDARYAAIHDAVAAGDIGEIVHIYARRFLPTWSPEHLKGRVEITHWTGVHDLDMMNWIVGRKAVRVTAHGRMNVLKALGVHDVIISTIEYADGTLAVLENSWATPTLQGRPRAYIFDVRGTKGSAEVSGYETGAQVYTEQSARAIDTFHRMKLNGVWVGAYRELVLNYFDAVLHGRPPLVAGEDGLASTLIADAILRSLASGRTEDVQWGD